MAKILIVSNAFYPENSPRSFRTTELAKEFGRQGHKVTVITHFNKKVHEEFVKKYNLQIKDLGKPRWNSWPVKGKGVVKFISRAFVRIIKLVVEFPDIQLVTLVKKALLSEKGYDLLISIAVPYPVHWGVAASRSAHPIAKIWVADCGDPYMGDRTDSFRKLFYFKYIEKWFSRKADFLCIPVEDAVNAYYKEFHHKIKVIPQGVRFQDFGVTAETYSPNDIITFCYAGSFIKGNRDPREFINYLINLESEFHFHIYTRTHDLIADLVEMSDGRVIVHDYISRKDLVARMAKMDFLVNFENNTRVQAPSKLIDYYLAQRPVLSIPYDHFDKETISQFLKRDFSQKLIMQGFEKFRIENVVSEFLKLQINKSAN
jgi:glycosyltransferase involved in cell wall biosynthesis